MSDLKVLFVSSEVFPYAKTGGLADVSGSLPKALKSLGADVRVITPYYRCISEGRFNIKKHTSRVKHRFSGKIFGFDLLSHDQDGVVTYFVRNDKYFSRKNLYSTSLGDYPDNALRFGFFSKASLVAMEVLDFKPDIVHCNDWQTALIPFFLRFKLPDDPYYSGIKTLFTIHNLAYQGVFSRIFMPGLNIPSAFFSSDSMEFHGKLNFMKAGIRYADKVNTVSRKYAEEILTPEFGCGLDGFLEERIGGISGIPNGVDYNEWDPAKDIFIKANYTPESIDKKQECKKDLMDKLQIDISLDRPVIGYIGRLAHQKGVDLVPGIMKRLKDMNAVLVVLGSGEEEYEKIFKKLAEEYPENMRLSLGMNEELAHKMEAGCDILIMPSRYEPCGLTQMYGIKYGTIPVVRATGGLDDVITDLGENESMGNGFKFSEADTESFFGALKRALLLYGNKSAWTKLMRRAMSYDFSWEHSAKEYIELYKKIKSSP